MDRTYSSRDGRYQHIEVRYEPTGITFLGDRSGSECVHKLKPHNYAEFVASIGQPVGTDIATAIGKVLDTNPALIWASIHGELTETEFSWQSMSEIDDMMNFFDSMKS
jgi:hypothetical protein